jgi:glyoxylase-like metal-dependent hydrolase (beta-lactamase superfamily II)
MEPQQKHLETRRPYQLFPGVPEYLRRGGVVPESDIDIVVLSHVHYDHHGDPEEFPNARFLVGSGALGVLKNGLGEGLGSHQYFKADLLPEERTREFPPPAAGEGWQQLGPFPHALDLFEDRSVFVLDVPGHLPGHVNLLCRVGEARWVCLCGDAFHDPRLLSGEKEIGTWEGEGGSVCCIHVDRGRAEESIEKLRKLREMGDVELIAAHDDGWAGKNEERFFPNHL